MPTYQKLPDGQASGIDKRKTHVMPWDCASPGNKSNRKPARQLLRWSPNVGRVTLIKVGPRIPKLAEKLAALQHHFAR